MFRLETAQLFVTCNRSGSPLAPRWSQEKQMACRCSAVSDSWRALMALAERVVVVGRSLESSAAHAAAPNDVAASPPKSRRRVMSASISTLPDVVVIGAGTMLERRESRNYGPSRPPLQRRRMLGWRGQVHRLVKPGPPAAT